MKKPLAILTTTLAAALGLLFLAACVNPFINPMKRDAGRTSGETGLVRVGTGAGAERTALPEAVFDHYEYYFSYEGGADELREPIVDGGDEFALEPGNWTVLLKAYAEPGNDSLAAEGRSDSFLVQLYEETEVRVRLSPVISGGRGTLRFALAYPSGAAVRSFTLTRLAGVEGIDLTASAQTSGEGLAGTIMADAGYYAVRVVLRKGEIETGKTEVAHLYHGLTTEISFEFTDDDFQAILVFSNADSGPGSLREAIANAPAGATIVLDLPEQSNVITLTSPLAINKSLAVNGGGATLTQTGSNRLIAITGGSSTVVVINRVHFKGGRVSGSGGAISAAGYLTLESCVFSDNRASASGGAVSNTTARTTVKGSTFYMNRADATGGAIYSVGTNAPVFLEGNVFYGNTAATAPAVYTSGDPSAYTFNASDSDIVNAGGTTISSGNRTLGAQLPISHLSFKPLGGLGSNGVEGVIANKPADYPLADFQGKLIPAANAAAGAVQTATAPGYILDYAALGPGAISVSSGSVDADGITSGTVSLSAAANANGEFRHWLVDGNASPETSHALTLTVNAHATVRAVFYAKASAAADNVPGSLREAVSLAEGVVLNGSAAYILYGDLVIGSGLVLEGNGATVNLNGHHLVVSGADTTAKISRVRFTGGAAVNGGAIENEGILTIESCVFSDNRSTGTAAANGGGALYSAGTATVLGSTFYGNKAASQGGAIRHSSGTVKFQGNLFWGNTAASYNVASGAPTSLGYNISDKPIGAGAAESGWTSATGDNQAAALPLSFVSFKPLAGRGALNAISARPNGYPAKDFYGAAIPATGAAAGAAQSAIAAAGYILDYAAQGPGTVELSGGTVNADGFVTGSVTLTAAGNTGSVVGAFKHWIVNGGSPQTANPLVFSTLSDHTTVRAVFGGTWTVSGGANSGPGSLREALGLLSDEDIVILSGQTIALTEPLPPLTKKFTIQGNGATLTQTGFVPGAATQLLSLGGGANAVISRVHFKGGRTTGNGGAVYNNGGTLVLESCVFSDNQGNSGGAVYAAGDLTVKASTFYGNSAAGNYGGGDLSLQRLRHPDGERFPGERPFLLYRVRDRHGRLECKRRDGGDRFHGSPFPALCLGPV
jgi:predicted outer membrane repeat protein